MSKANSPELDAVLSAVRKLTPQERTTVMLAITAQDRLPTTPKKKGENASADWLLPGIEYELRRRGLFSGNFTPAMITSLAPGYTADSAQVREDLKKRLTKSGPITYTELLGFGRLCAECLASYVKDHSGEAIPLGPKTMLRAVPDMLTALNHSFPGYLTAGILRGMIRL